MGKGWVSKLMNTYYVGSIPVTDELYHHGIKGQKWGIRRYQNEDGSLTAEGRRRYGDSLGEYANRSQSVLRRLASGDVPVGFLRTQRIGDKLEARYKRKESEKRSSGNSKEADSYKRLYEAQRQKNIDRDTYVSKTSTGKLLAQNFLLGDVGATSYRVARQRGQTRGQAAVSGILASIPYVGFAASIGSEAYKSKKAYGSIAI